MSQLSSHRAVTDFSTSSSFDRGLWQRLLLHQIGPPQAQLQFVDRLARENGWHLAFAERVMLEYRRFCYLAITCAHPVTPSDAVDQAWHLHLTYTRDYWQSFCPDVLCTPLHHGPTLGGAEEGQKFSRWYAQTIASYEQIFGELPPLDIWPNAAERFADPARFQRIDTSAKRRPIQSWLSSVVKRSAVGTFVLGTLIAVWPDFAAAQAHSANVFDWNAPEFLKFYAIGGLIMLTLSIALRMFARTGDRTGMPVRSLTSYEEAYLSGEQARVIDVAAVELLQRKAVIAGPDGLRANGSAQGNSSIERSVLMELRKHKKPVKMINLKFATHPALKSMQAELVRLGLLMSAAERWRKMLICGAPLLLWLALGLIRMAIGIARDRPVAFLGILCVLTAVALLMLSMSTPKKTRAGSEKLTQLTSAHARLARAPLPEEYARGVALFGITCLMFTPLSIYADWRRTPEGGSGDSGTSSSSSSDSSSDGGGSGCGGCGGGGD